MKIDQYSTKYIALVTRFVKEQSLQLRGLYCVLNDMEPDGYYYPHMLLFRYFPPAAHKKWLKFIAPIMAVDLFDFLVLKGYIPSSVIDLINVLQNTSLNRYLGQNCSALGDYEELGFEFMSWLIEKNSL